MSAFANFEASYLNLLETQCSQYIQMIVVITTPTYVHVLSVQHYFVAAFKFGDTMTINKLLTQCFWKGTL